MLQIIISSLCDDIQERACLTSLKFDIVLCMRAGGIIYIHIIISDQILVTWVGMMLQKFKVINIAEVS